MKKIDLDNLKAWIHWRVVSDEKQTAENLEFTYVIKSLIDSHAMLLKALKEMKERAADFYSEGFDIPDSVDKALKEAGEE